MPPAIRHATVKDILGWMFRRYRRFRISGDSMSPRLLPGNEVLIDPRAFNRNPPLEGDIVVAAHPKQAGLLIIKRVEFVENDGRCYLKGDNRRESSDSRQFGLVNAEALRGKVICLFP